MGQGITTLPDDVVRLIAAGEVIDSLAAIARELAENAIDAGATRITIALWLDQWRMRVTDNGMGMTLTDLTQAATAHSTSKIRDRPDLWQITSLGFRGEALHSLAQFADVQIASRPANTSDSDGWLASYDERGEVRQLEPIAIAPGTIVTADHIFANLPGRRQGLPPASQQLRAIQTVVHHLALCHPHVTWQVQHRDRDWFTLFPGTSARQIVPQILREVQESDLQPFTLILSDKNHIHPPENTESTLPAPHDDLVPALDLVVGVPDRCHRHRPDWVKIAVNGRFVRLPELEHTILSSFRRTLPRDRFPVCFVHLRVPPDQIDWNRHPAKTEIYLQALDQWRAAIAQAIEQSLRLQPHALPDSLYVSRVERLLKTAETGESYGTHPLTPDSSASRDTTNSLQPLKVLAQVHKTYILVEHPAGIWLIEQHIAHERVLFETLCDRWQLEPLTNPIILNHLTPAQQEQLHHLGLELEPFGESAWVVRSVPSLLAARDDCADALLEISLGRDLPAAQAAIACRSAIRNGTSLTQTEMQTLIDQWQQTRHPRTCPHGRPICLTLEESSLARFFRRNWMIGKSHGL